jgi:DNA-binding XRE family transcriptional regulator
VAVVGMWEAGSDGIGVTPVPLCRLTNSYLFAYHFGMSEAISTIDGLTLADGSGAAFMAATLPHNPPSGIAGNLARNVRTFRLERGWSQEQLAEMCGWAQARISEIEAGKQDRRLETLQKLATAFGVTPESMLREDLVEAEAR